MDKTKSKLISYDTTFDSVSYNFQYPFMQLFNRNSNVKLLVTNYSH